MRSLARPTCPGGTGSSGTRPSPSSGEDPLTRRLLTNFLGKRKPLNLQDIFGISGSRQASQVGFGRKTSLVRSPTADICKVRKGFQIADELHCKIGEIKMSAMFRDTFHSHIFFRDSFENPESTPIHITNNQVCYRLVCFIFIL